MDKKNDLLEVLEQTNVSAFLNGWGPVSVIQVYDSEIGMQGILIIDNNILGPALGGIKISPGITPRKVFQDARKMTLSCSLVNVNFGGASAGIRANPSEINKTETLKSFARGVSPYVPNQYIAAPDENVGKEEIAVFVDELGDRQGATGKPGHMGGIPYELGSIGFGMGVSTETSIDMLRSISDFPHDISETKIAIQGFDVNAFTLAKYFSNKCAKIVAICDDWCTIRDPAGIDIDKIAKHSASTNEKNSLKSCKDVEKLATDDIFNMKCDILALTKCNKALKREDIDSIGAKCIIEGANDLIDPASDHFLNEKNIVVLPDILTTAGGVISSHAEHNRNSSEMAFSLIESRIKEATKNVVQSSLELDISLRRMAKEIAKERILQAMEAKE